MTFLVRFFERRNGMVQRSCCSTIWQCSQDHLCARSSFLCDSVLCDVEPGKEHSPPHVGGGPTFLDIQENGAKCEVPERAPKAGTNCTIRGRYSRKQTNSKFIASINFCPNVATSLLCIFNV